jgi:Rrf2 family protein
MLTKTAETGIQMLIYMALSPERDQPVPPKVLAGELGHSPSYLAKIAHELARAGLLRAHRGTKGGVILSRPPEQVRLLDIVQSLQGVLNGDYCRTTGSGLRTCGFHRAMLEVHQSVVEALSRWTLADLAKSPNGTIDQSPSSLCRMHAVGAAIGRRKGKPAGSGGRAAAGLRARGKAS